MPELVAVAAAIIDGFYGMFHLWLMLRFLIEEARICLHVISLFFLTISAHNMAHAGAPLNAFLEITLIYDNIITNS